MLQQIAEELTEDAGQDTVNMVTAFFIDHQQYDKAVQLLVRTGQVIHVLSVSHDTTASSAIRCCGVVHSTQCTSDRGAG